jgi:hypothetical protein
MIANTMDPVSFLENQTIGKAVASTKTTTTNTTTTTKQSAASISIKDPIAQVHESAPVMIPTVSAKSTTTAKKYQYQVI